MTIETVQEGGRWTSRVYKSGVFICIFVTPQLNQFDHAIALDTILKKEGIL